MQSSKQCAGYWGGALMSALLLACSSTDSHSGSTCVPIDAGSVDGNLASSATGVSGTEGGTASNVTAGFSGCDTDRAATGAGAPSGAPGTGQGNGEGGSTAGRGTGNGGGDGTGTGTSGGATSDGGLGTGAGGGPGSGDGTGTGTGTGT